MPDQPTNARLLFIKQAISTTAWPELCVMLLDAMQEQQNMINLMMQTMGQMVAINSTNRDRLLQLEKDVGELKKLS